MTRPAAVTNPPTRVWVYPHGTWTGPLVMRGNDEFGRCTVAFRLPGQRGLVIAYRWCADVCCSDRCPATGYPHDGYVGDRPVCAHCSPDLTVQEDAP